MCRRRVLHFDVINFIVHVPGYPVLCLGSLLGHLHTGYLKTVSTVLIRD